jgi:predicted DNA-binding transcriptional regulator AlpA
MSSAEQHSTPLLTAKDVARQLCVSEAWVRDHALGRRLPTLPAIRLGQGKCILRFRRADIDSFLALHTRNAEGVSCRP